MNSLINYLIEEERLKSPHIIEAFKKIKRNDFLPEDIKFLSEEKKALPIGHNQTISQPLVVAFMIEELQPQKGDKILDVGSGSGWTTALLSQIVGSEGRVIAIELIPELKNFGEKNVSHYNFIKKGVAKFICKDGSKGYEKEAPFDKILASASARKIPQAWKEQLKIGGKIVAPVKSSIWVVTKNDKNDFKEEEHYGFSFVPLIEK